jgi:hypothetical protein
MSFPNIPNVTSVINITQGQTIDLLLASIAFEELGLSHILNAEGEKIQSVVGTLPGLTPTVVPIGDLQAIDTSVATTLKTIIKKEMILEFKLENLIQLIQVAVPPTVCPCTITLDVAAIEVIILTVNGNIDVIFEKTVAHLGPVSQSIVDCEPNLPSVTIAANDIPIGTAIISFSVTITPSGPEGTITLTFEGTTTTENVVGISTIMCSL